MTNDYSHELLIGPDWLPGEAIEYTMPSDAECRTFVHDTETIDGVLFVRTSRLDADGKLLERRLIRADHVKG